MPQLYDVLNILLAIELTNYIVYNYVVDAGEQKNIALSSGMEFLDRVVLNFYWRKLNILFGLVKYSLSI